jgi:hypothetical protein
MESLSRATRDKIASAAHYRCAYCQTAQEISGARLFRRLRAMRACGLVEVLSDGAMEPYDKGRYVVHAPYMIA